ncbi:hypothetical protein Tco_0922524 [Tanacetum coccineum]|uniref:Uncharacterized protein n=1 Tax=Tanacetum coccineum TaxID=301880 RepID=A0ABQ5CYC3_9ASTR
MSDTIPPIPPPFGDNIGNPSSHIRAGNPTDTINNTTTTSVVQNVDSDFDIEEDQRSSSEFIADLNAVFHERALLANQRRFYKRSGRVGSSKKPMDMSNETCFAWCQYYWATKSTADIDKAATAAIVSAVCQANDHGFGGIWVPKQKRNTGIESYELMIDLQSIRDPESINFDEC